MNAEQIGPQVEGCLGWHRGWPTVIAMVRHGIDWTSFIRAITYSGIVG